MYRIGSFVVSLTLCGICAETCYGRDQPVYGRVWARAQGQEYYFITEVFTGKVLGNEEPPPPPPPPP